MSHTICGIDLGAFSIKLVMLEVGFRQTHLRGLLETAVPGGDAPLLERQAEAIQDAFSRVSAEATPYLALPGDMLSIRLLDLPFADPRKIDQVVGYELEGQIVHALDDVVYDHMLVRASDAGSTVLAVAAKRDDIAQYLAGLEAHGTEPRSLYAAPIVYRSLSGARPAVAHTAAFEDVESSCQVILDLGHVRTNLCIVRDGQALYARTIKRAGFHLTTAIAQAFNSTYDRAEQAKRGDGRLSTAARPPANPVEAKLDLVLREALTPLVRELRQTLSSFRAASKENIDAVLITGGTGRLRGLPQFLESELGVPARFLAVRSAAEMKAQTDDDGANTVVEADESSPYALATAIALAASRGNKEIDLRRGPFVYRASFSVLRQKAMHLGLLVAGLLIAIGLDVGAALTNLGSERKELDLQLKTATQELLGQSNDDAKAVTLLVSKGFKEELAPLPKATAFDLLDQISRKVPSDEKIKLDVMELDIRPKKTFLKGTVDSAAAVDEIGTKLKEIDCYEDVSKGAITEVSGGGKQFTMSINSKCP